MVNRLVLLVGAIILLGSWAAACHAVTLPFHPQTPFASIMVFLGTVASAAYRIRVLPGPQAAPLGQRALGSMVESRVFRHIGPAHRVADGAIIVLFFVFGMHALLWLPSLGIGMLAATFDPSAGKNPLLS